jgi:hypothetical protein
MRRRRRRPGFRSTTALLLLQYRFSDHQHGTAKVGRSVLRLHGHPSSKRAGTRKSGNTGAPRRTNRTRRASIRSEYSYAETGAPRAEYGWPRFFARAKVHRAWRITQSGGSTPAGRWPAARQPHSQTAGKDERTGRASPVLINQTSHRALGSQSQDTAARRSATRAYALRLRSGSRQPAPRRRVRPGGGLGMKRAEDR